MALAAAWGLASLLAAYWVYDRSGIYDLGWLPGLLREPPRCWVNVHAGLDETSPALQALFPTAESRVLDIHDPASMSEPAIGRARRRGPPPVAPEPANPRRLPLPDASAEAIVLVFAAHEIRDPGVRLAFFRELRRVLDPEGRIVLVEHLRDLANVLVFGPGAWHFLPEREWRRLGRESRLALHRSVRLTPFVRVFVLAAA
jgi:SAM-dependent methyltransferase